MILTNSIFSNDEINTIKNKKVSILGLGGLGGNLSNLLIRTYVEKINIVDFDTFDISNLNRQLFANADTIGKKKVDIVKSELEKINSNADIKGFDIKLDSDNISSIIEGSDIVIDALDNIEGRVAAINACKEFNIPFIFGAVYGFYGYISLIKDYSKTNIIDLINEMSKSADIHKETTSFSVSVVASIQVSEAIKYLLNKDSKARDKLITIDIENNTIKIINID